MITAEAGPLVVQPTSWVLVFDRVASTPLKGAVACGEYKHVRAFAYVPFLHVWIFVDPHFAGTDILVAGNGAPARAVIASWLEHGGGDLLQMPVAGQRVGFPLIGWCVPQIKRLIGLRSGALRPDALWRDCLRNGGAEPDGYGRKRRVVHVGAGHEGGRDGRQAGPGPADGGPAAGAGAGVAGEPGPGPAGLREAEH